MRTSKSPSMMLSSSKLLKASDARASEVQGTMHWSERSAASAHCPGTSLPRSLASEPVMTFTVGKAVSVSLMRNRLLGNIRPQQSKVFSSQVHMHQASVLMVSERTTYGAKRAASADELQSRSPALSTVAMLRESCAGRQASTAACT